MRTRFVAGLALCLATLACAETKLPTGPTATPALSIATAAAQTAETSSTRVVSSGSGPTEPPCLTARPCRLIGNIHMTAAGGTLQGTYSPFTTVGAQTLTNIYDFALLARLAGTGRFAGLQSSPTVSLQVTAGVATAVVYIPAAGDRSFIATSSGTPVFTLIADSSCLLTGQRLQTRVVVTLEHLGKTEITDSHCTLK